MASNLYPKGIKYMLESGIATPTPKLAILIDAVATYAYDKDHDFFDTQLANAANPSACEFTADGTYTQGGKEVTPVITVVTLTATTGRIKIVIDATDETWASLTTGRNVTGAVFYGDTADDQTSPLYAYYAVTATTDGTNFTLDIDETNGNIWLPYTLS